MDDAPWVSSDDEDDVLDEQRAAEVEAERKSRTASLMAQIYSPTDSASKRPKSAQVQSSPKDAPDRRPKSGMPRKAPRLSFRRPRLSIKGGDRKAEKIERKIERKIEKVFDCFTMYAKIQACPRKYASHGKQKRAINDFLRKRKSERKLWRRPKCMYGINACRVHGRPLCIHLCFHVYMQAVIGRACIHSTALHIGHECYASMLGKMDLKSRNVF